MKERIIFILIILIMMMSIGTVFADSYRNSFLDTYGNKVYFSNKYNNDGTYTITIEEHGITHTDDSYASALLKAQIEYEKKVSYPTASNNDDLATKKSLENLDLDKNNILTRYLKNYFPEHIKWAMYFFQLVLSVTLSRCIWEFFKVFAFSGVSVNNPKAKAELYESLMDVGIKFGINVFLIANTALVQHLVTTFVTSIFYSKDVATLANKANIFLHRATTITLGLGVLTWVLVMIIMFIKLGISSVGNSKKRSEVISELGTKFLLLILFGGGNLILSILFNLFNVGIM